MVAFELEKLSRRFDRFGWERDRNTPAHDQIIREWIEALADFPLSEIKAACRAWVMSGKNKTPTEGQIKNLILLERQKAVQRHRAQMPHATEPERVRCSAKRANEICEELGFKKRWG